jgi:hypothetical protein
MTHTEPTRTEPISASEREKQIAEEYHDFTMMTGDDWYNFLQSSMYRSIPPARTFEGEIEARMPDENAVRTQSMWQCPYFPDCFIAGVEWLKSALLTPTEGGKP